MGEVPLRLTSRACRRGCAALSNRLREASGSCGSPHGRLSFRRSNARSASQRAWRRLPHAARRRRHLPAVASEDLSQHQMHAESFSIPAATAYADRQTRRRRSHPCGRHHIAASPRIGNQRDGSIRAGSAETSLFITPGYRFRAVDIAPHELPPAAFDVADAGQRFRGLRDDSPPPMRSDPRALPFFSYGERCCCDARRRRATDAIRLLRPTAGRATRGSRSPTALSRHRCSCRWERTEPSRRWRQRASRTRRAGGAGQHVSTSGCGRERKCAAHDGLHGSWAGTDRFSPIRAVSRCSASARCARSPRKAWPSPSPVNATGCS